MPILDKKYLSWLQSAVAYACRRLEEEEDAQGYMGPSAGLQVWREIKEKLKHGELPDIPSPAAGVTTPEWISVDDWLPNHNREVLTWDKAQLCISVYHVCDNEWVTDLGDPSDELGYTCTLTPTHWMPIPPPPDEVRETLKQKARG